MVDEEFPFGARDHEERYGILVLVLIQPSLPSVRKQKGRDNASGTTCNIPGLCVTVKSCDCNDIAKRVNMFDVSCIE